MTQQFLTRTEIVKRLVDCLTSQETYDSDKILISKQLKKFAPDEARAILNEMSQSDPNNHRILIALLNVTPKDKEELAVTFIDINLDSN